MKKFNLSKGLLVGLLTLALCFTMFGVVKASADETEPTEVSTVIYIPELDAIKSTQKAVVYVVKNASGNTIKAGATAVTISANKAVAVSDLGVKGTKKDVYLHIVDKEYTSDKSGASANFIIKAQAAKKIIGTINYTRADASEGIDSYYAILSAQCLDASKKELESPVIYWATEADGKYKKASLTTTEWTSGFSNTYAYGSSNTAGSGDVTKGAFTSDKLLKLLETGGTVYVKQIGESTESSVINGGKEENVRTSAPVKVKIAKQGKAVSVKLDSVKGTLSLKNGFDFALALVNGKKYEVKQWFTILPQLKGAATKTLDDSIVKTDEYLPLAKKDTTAKLAKNDESREGDYANKVSYTNYKFKSVSVKDIAKVISSNSGDCTANYTGSNSGEMIKVAGDPLTNGFVLAVRKSATEKKPISAVTYVKISKETEAPLVLTESCVSGQYLVSTSDDFAKKGIAIGTIKNYPGSISGETATSGYYTSFKLLAASSTSGDNDKNPEAYEYAIVKAENVKTLAANADDEEKNAQIDWTTVAWKKFDPAKTKITDKLKTKYNTVGGSKVEAKLDAVSISADPFDPVTATLPENAASDSDKPTTYILIRRAGVKGKTADDAVLGSKYVKLYVAKADKTYYLFSTEDLGSEAFSYTIRFLKWGENENGTFEYVEQKDLKQFGWLANGTSGELTKVANAGSSFEYLYNNSNLSGSGEANSKFAVTMSGSTSISGDIYIREYAKIKIDVSISGLSGESTKTFNLIDTNTTAGTIKSEVSANSGSIISSSVIKNPAAPLANIASAEDVTLPASDTSGKIFVGAVLTENYGYDLSGVGTWVSGATYEADIPSSLEDYVVWDKTAHTIKFKANARIDSATAITGKIVITKQ